MQNPATTPERPQDSLYRRTDISPEVFFQTLGRVRRAARDEIERLIEWLDSTIDCDQDEAVDDRGCDGDTDAEPSLGSFDRMSNQIKAWQSRGYADVDVELDRCDDEPSLGSIEASINHGYSYFGEPRYLTATRFNQNYTYAQGSRDDREGDEHDGREPDVDDEDGADKEPTFGWSDEEAARGRYPSLMGHRAEHEGE